jgi:O-antigen/teichoic acid export membrane protein
MLGLLVCCTVMRLPLTPLEFGLYVRQRFVLQNLIGLGVEIAKMALLFALLFGVSTRVLWVVVAEVAGQSLSSVIMVSISRRSVPAMRFSTSRIDWGIARQIIGFGGWSLVIDGAASAQRMLDPLFLNKLARLVDVTSYHIATMPARHIQSFAAVATGPLLPQLIAMHAAGRHEQMRRLYLRSGRYGLWVVLGITLPAMVYCRELITLYLGPQYIETAFVMVLTLLATMWTYSNWMLPTLCQAKDRMRPIALRHAAMQLVRIGLIVYFVGWRGLGALGLAGAGLVAAAALAALNLPLGWRLAGVSGGQWFREVIVKGSLPGAAAMLVWVGLEIARPPSTWTLLGLYVAAGLAAYLAMLLLYSFDSYDWTQIREIAGRLSVQGRRMQCRPSLFPTASDDSYSK